MTHEKIATLAERLEFANALRKQADRDLSALRVERGKDAAYIMELEAKNAALSARVSALESAVQSLKSVKRKTPEQRAGDREAKLADELRSCRKSRDELIAQLNRSAVINNGSK